MPGVETLHLTSDRDRPRVPRRSLFRIYLFVAVLLVITGFGAWVAAGTGTFGQLLGVVLVLMMLSATATFVVGTSARRTGRLMVEQRDRSLRLPGASVMWRLILTLLVLTVLLPVLVVGAQLVGDVEVPTVAVSGSLVLLVLGPPVGVQVLRGKIRAPYLELDVDGLTHHGMNASTTVLWDDVTGLRLVADPGRRLVVESRGTPQRTVRSATPGERPVGGPRVAAGEVSVPAAFLGSDAAVVADLIEAHRADPRLRAGLATGATLERLRAGRLHAGS